MSFNTGGYSITGNTLNMTGYMGNPFTITVTGSDTIGSVLAGTASVTKAGSGTLTLTASGALPSTTALTVSGGTLDITGTSQTIASLSGGGAITGSSGSLTVTGGGTYSGTFSGSVGLISSGCQLVLLGSANSFGSVGVTGGILVVGGSLTSGSDPIIDPGGTLQIGYWGTTGSVGGDINDNGAVAFDRTDSLTYSGTISGTGSLEKYESGTLTLTGSNNYSGGTTIAVGTLQAGAEYALSPYSDVTVDDNCTLDLAGFDNEVNTLAGSGTVENSAADTTATLVVGNNTTGSTFSGVLQEDVGTGQLALDKIGGDTLTLAGTNTYSGQTTVEGGTLSLTGSIASSPVVLAGGVVSGSGTYESLTVATTTTLTSQPDNPSVSGESVTFTATVSPINLGYVIPSGTGETVAFYDETTGAPLGTGNLDVNGVATWTVSDLDVEDHYITATYSGDTTYGTSASDPLDQEVDPATTSVAIPSSATFYDGSVELDATVSVDSPGSGTPTGGVEFYDGSTDLGAGALDGSGHASLTTSDVVPGSHTITAVYSGDDNFPGSQSTASVSVVGETLSIDNPVVTPFTPVDAYGYEGDLYEGDVATVSGGVSNLDGAAFTVEVNWGDGNSAEDFHFAAGSSSFSVSHRFMLDSAAGQVNVDSSNGWATASETYQIGVTVTSGDNRTATGGASVTVVDPGPTILFTTETWGTPGDYTSLCTVTAFAYEAWNPTASFTYQWMEGGINGEQLGDGPTCTDVSFAERLMGVAVIATDANGASNVQGFSTTVQSPPAEPTVSISTDANQMVFEGDPATFAIHAESTTQPTYDMTVFYSTMDPPGGATAYTSSYGPQEVRFSYTAFTFNEATGEWSAPDKTFTINTAGGINGGGDASVSVQLSHPYLAVLGGSGTDTATATIVRPEVDITSPGSPSARSTWAMRVRGRR